MNARTLIEKIEALPPERRSEIEDFVAFLELREEARARNWQVTVEAMEAARRGETVRVGDVAGLFANLHADD